MRIFYSTLVLLHLSAAAVVAVEKAPPPRQLGRPSSAVVTSSLATGAVHIRQFAFDGDRETYFASDKNATKTDHFTLIFDNLITVKSVRVISGRPDGKEAIGDGVLEVSTNGKTFAVLAKFADGSASGTPKAKVKAIRVRPTADLETPLAIREIVIDANPVVGHFHYPIEFVVDVTDAPEMKQWAETVANICERQYPMICTELMSDGFKPLNVIHMTMKNDYNGVAEAGGGRIKGSVKFFKMNPTDVGAMVHETAHCVQLYQGRDNPGWLVEGMADYVRFYKFEPKRPGPLAPERAKFDGSYRTTAAFLAFLNTKCDPMLTRKLNGIMRDGKYNEGVWKELTGKTAEELGREWQKSLAK